MNDDVRDEIPQELLESSLQLSSAARRKMAELLLESTAPDLDVKMLLTKRWEDYTSGKTKSISFEECMSRLLTSLGERKE